jgi:hypothetical protein
MLEDFLSLVPSSILHRSGAVFYSGASAFDHPCDVYLLGLNPGGSPIAQAQETISRNIADALTSARREWSAYADESWQGRPPGSHGMQPRVLHLLRGLNLDPREVPASNIIFVRTNRESHLATEKRTMLNACWPVHRSVIEKLHIKAVLCFGGTAGQWTREALGAHKLVGIFTENNARRWTSQAHENPGGGLVLTLTHPSIADWRAPSTDPTSFVKAMLGLAQNI